MATVTVAPQTVYAHECLIHLFHGMSVVVTVVQRHVEIQLIIVKSIAADAQQQQQQQLQQQQHQVVVVASHELNSLY